MTTDEEALQRAVSEALAANDRKRRSRFWTWFLPILVVVGVIVLGLLMEAGVKGAYR